MKYVVIMSDRYLQINIVIIVMDNIKVIFAFDVALLLLVCSVCLYKTNLIFSLHIVFIFHLLNTYILLKYSDRSGHIYVL